MTDQSTVDSRQSTAQMASTLAYRFREGAVIEVEGLDRVEFLQGQLTQDVKTMRPGDTRPTAALTPKGKLIFVGRLHMMPDRIRLLLSRVSRDIVLTHLRKYAAFQKVSVSDSTDSVLRIGLYGSAGTAGLPEGAALLPGEGELAGELLVPRASSGELDSWLGAQGGVLVSDEEAEIRRVEAGRPRFGQDADQSHLPDEVGLDDAVSTTKGCYVGQEIVARMRTYGRANRRLVGFRFPEGAIPAGALLKLPEEEEPGKVEQGRVTSSVRSPRFGAIGLGYAFRDVSLGGRLVSVESPSRPAIVTETRFV